MSMSKIALAIPLALGMACSTTGTQSSSSTVASWSDYEPSDGSMPSDRPARGVGATVPTAATASSDTHDGLSVQPTAGSSSGSSSSGSMGTGSSDSSGSSGSTSGAGGSSGDTGAPGSSDQGGQMGSGGSSETMGTGNPQGSSGEGTAGSSDQAQQGGAMAGDTGAHHGDQKVMGKITKISKDEISIQPKGGVPKTLKLNDDTSVTVNGKDGKWSQLKKGQAVRATYENVGGDDVAVRLESGAARHGRTTKAGTSGKTGSDTGMSR